MEIYRTIQPGQDRLQKIQTETVGILRHLDLVAFEQPQLAHVRPDDFGRLRDFGRGVIDMPGEGIAPFVQNGLPDPIFAQSQAPMTAMWNGAVYLDGSVLVIGMRGCGSTSLSCERAATQQSLADIVPDAENYCDDIFLRRLPQRHELPLFACRQGIPRAKLRAVQVRVGRVLADRGLGQLPIGMGPVEYRVE